MSQDDSHPPEITQQQFLIFAGLFDALLLATAFLGGWVTGISPVAELRWTAADLLIGLLGTAPMVVLLLVAYRIRWKPFLEIRELLRTTLGGFLADCRLIDLILLALLTGICEEILFRGLLYFWIANWHVGAAIAISSLIFGLAHAVTPAYTAIAGLIGVYLTALLMIGDPPNLLAPITTHAVYDFIGFLVVAHDYRRSSREPPRDRPGPPEPS